MLRGVPTRSCQTPAYEANLMWLKLLFVETFEKTPSRTSPASMMI